MFVLETEVLEFCLYLVQSQSVCQRSVDIQCFASNLILLVGRLRLQCAHVVQTVAYLDKDDADIFAHRQQ